MPVNRNQRLPTRERIKLYAEDQSITNAWEAAKDGVLGQFVNLYAAIGEKKPGWIDDAKTFYCELDVGHVGILMECLRIERVQGVLELTISDRTPGWKFRENGLTRMRFRITPRMLRPVRQPPSGLLNRFNRLIARQPQVLDPEVFEIDQADPDAIPVKAPTVSLELFLEDSDTASDSSSRLSLDLNIPIPDVRSHGACLIVELVCNVTPSDFK